MRNKSIFIFLIYLSFFILIPIIKNETRLIEKKIESFENKIASLEKHLIEASLEFQYLSSAENLYKTINKNLDLKYESLDVSQIYSSLEAFINQQKQLSKISTNETQTK